MWTLLRIGSYSTTTVGIMELNRQDQQGILQTTLGHETITVPCKPEGKLSFVGVTGSLLNTMLSLYKQCFLDLIRVHNKAPMEVPDGANGTRHDTGA